MEIYRSIDIEDAVRIALSEYQTVYCAPLPAEYDLPNILVTATGGSSASRNACVKNFCLPGRHSGRSG